MGTSGSSPGPGPGVPLVPRWVPDLPPAAPPTPEPPLPPDIPPDIPPSQNPANQNVILPPVIEIPLPPSQVNPQSIQVNLAPQRRFLGTRHSLGKFAGTGSRDDLRKGLGHYVRHGLGGSTAGAQRMGSTAIIAGALYDRLSALQSGQATAAQLGVDPASLAGRTVNEVMDVIMEAIRPIDGTQDSEANRQAIDYATADLLTQFPNVDMTTLTAVQIELLIERYVAYDLCLRVELDVGSKIEINAPDPSTAVTRLEDMKEFIVAEVHTTFQAQRGRGERLQRGRVGLFVTSTLKEILRIFEEYLQ